MRGAIIPVVLTDASAAAEYWISPQCQGCQFYCALCIYTGEVVRPVGVIK